MPHSPIRIIQPGRRCHLPKPLSQLLGQFLVLGVKPMPQTSYFRSQVSDSFSLRSPVLRPWVSLGHVTAPLHGTSLTALLFPAAPQVTHSPSPGEDSELRSLICPVSEGVKGCAMPCFRNHSDGVQRPKTTEFASVKMAAITLPGVCCSSAKKDFLPRMSKWALPMNAKNWQ